MTGLRQRLMEVIGQYRRLIEVGHFDEVARDLNHRDWMDDDDEGTVPTSPSLVIVVTQLLDELQLAVADRDRGAALEAIERIRLWLHQTEG